MQKMMSSGRKGCSMFKIQTDSDLNAVQLVRHIKLASKPEHATRSKMALSRYAKTGLRQHELTPEVILAICSKRRPPWVLGLLPHEGIGPAALHQRSNLVYKGIHGRLVIGQALPIQHAIARGDRRAIGLLLHFDPVPVRQAGSTLKTMILPVPDHSSSIRRRFSANRLAHARHAQRALAAGIADVRADRFSQHLATRRTQWSMSGWAAESLQSWVEGTLKDHPAARNHNNYLIWDLLSHRYDLPEAARLDLDVEPALPDMDESH